MIASFSPDWFFGFDVAFELAFAIVSIIVCMLAYTLFRKISQKNLLYFSISFFLIGLSYFFQSLLNLLIISKANEQICQAMKFQSIALFNFYGLIIHMIFMISGFAILLFTIFRTDNIKLLILLILISILGIIYSSNALITYYLFSTIYLVFLSIHFIMNYLKTKKSNPLLIAIAFIFLLFGNFHFLISVNHQLFYVIGHILEFFAYLLILINLYIITKK